MKTLLKEIRRHPLSWGMIGLTIAYFGLHFALWVAGISMKDLTMQALWVK